MRRFDALKVYMLLRALGREAIGAMADHRRENSQ